MLDGFLLEGLEVQAGGNSAEDLRGLFSERACPVCGKTFIITGDVGDYAWTIGRRRYVCSYSCMRKAEKKKK